jgi:hypothetical protein
VALVFVASAAGCAFNEPVTCPDEALFSAPALACEAAVDAARPRLSGTSGITALSFDYAMCPPDARCRFPDGASGTVVATLEDGRRVGVFVGVDPNGAMLTEPPRLLTPPPQPMPVGG